MAYSEITIFDESIRGDVYGTSATVDLSGSTSTTFFLRPTSLSGSNPAKTFEVLIEESADGSSWVEIARLVARAEGVVETLHTKRGLTSRLRARWIQTGSAFGFELKAVTH